MRVWLWVSAGLGLQNWGIIVSDADREARLAARLRDNLKKRKALAKTRAVEDGAEPVGQSDAAVEDNTDTDGSDDGGRRDPHN